MTYRITDPLLACVGGVYGLAVIEGKRVCIDPDQTCDDGYASYLEPVVEKTIPTHRSTCGPTSSNGTSVCVQHHSFWNDDTVFARYTRHGANIHFTSFGALPTTVVRARARIFYNRSNTPSSNPQYLPPVTTNGQDSAETAAYCWNAIVVCGTIHRHRSRRLGHRPDRERPHLRPHGHGLAVPLTGHAYGPAALIVLIGGAGLAGSDEAPWLARLEIDKRPVCYGTAINGRWVLTVRHCIASDTSTEKMDPLRIAGRFADSLVGVDEVHIPYARNLGISDLTGTDAALLHLRSPRAQTAPLGEVGSAKQAWAMVTELKTGRASLVTIRAVRNKSIYTKGVTRPGQSGSPLLSEDGAVIGIASWRSGRTGTGGLSAFTPVDPLRAWMRCVRDAQSPAARRACPR